MAHNAPLSTRTEQEGSYTPEELAKLHKVSPKTIRRLFEGEASVIRLRRTVTTNGGPAT